MNARSQLVGISDHCPPLLRSWLDLERSRGVSLTDSLAALNAAANTSYSLSRLGEWRGGKRALPAAVADALRWQMLPVLCQELGITVTRKQLDRLYQAISDAPLGRPRI
jgi:hypothetical protein